MGAECSPVCATYVAVYVIQRVLVKGGNIHMLMVLGNTVFKLQWLKSPATIKTVCSICSLSCKQMSTGYSFLLSLLGSLISMWNSLSCRLLLVVLALLLVFKLYFVVRKRVQSRQRCTL